MKQSKKKQVRRLKLPVKHLTHDQRLMNLETSNNNLWAALQAQGKLLEVAMQLLEAFGAEFIPEDNLEKLIGDKDGTSTETEGSKRSEDPESNS